MKGLAIALLPLLAAASVHAEERGSDAKRQEYFAKAKEVKLVAMRERIALMQDSMGCVQSAQTPDAMRSCEQRERSAMEEHQRRMKQRWEATKPR